MGSSNKKTNNKSNLQSETSNKYKTLFEKDEEKFEFDLDQLTNSLEEDLNKILNGEIEAENEKVTGEIQLISDLIDLCKLIMNKNKEEVEKALEPTAFKSRVEFIKNEKESHGYFEAFSYYKEIFEAYNELTNSINETKIVNNTNLYYTKFAHVISSFKFFNNKLLDLNKKYTDLKSIIQQQANYQEIAKSLSSSEDNLQQYKTKLDKIEKKLDSAVSTAVTEAVQKTTSHTLTLMGVFTAVIAMVVSVAVTSSSWLSNANGASAIISFVIPNLVIIIGILLMLSFITFIYREGKKRQIFSAIVFGVLIAFAIIFSSINIPKMITDVREGVVAHNRHILSMNEYEIVTSNDNKAFVFTFEFIEYAFEYDERLLHDGNLYFCEEHKTLE